MAKLSKKKYQSQKTAKEVEFISKTYGSRTRICAQSVNRDASSSPKKSRTLPDRLTTIEPESISEFQDSDIFQKSGSSKKKSGSVCDNNNNLLL